MCPKLINPDPLEDPKSRSLKGVPKKYPLVVWGPNFGDLLFRYSRGSGKGASNGRAPLQRVHVSPDLAQREFRRGAGLGSPIQEPKPHILNLSNSCLKHMDSYWATFRIRSLDGLGNGR